MLRDPRFDGRFARMRRPLLVLAAAAMLLLAMSAAAAAAGPVWRLDSTSKTNAPASGTVEYLVQATNVGDADTDGTPFTLVATLPAPAITGASASGSGLSCGPAAGETVITCTSSNVLARGRSLTLLLRANVAPGATGTPTATFEISGGGPADTARTADAVTISSVVPPFGIAAFDAQVVANEDGDAFTQAGGHPYGASTSIEFNADTTPRGIPTLQAAPWPIEPTKTVEVDLPPGFVGNPTLATRCTLADLSNTEVITARPLCAPSSQVGSALVRVSSRLQNNLVPVPVFNLVPPPDVPGRFGFNVFGSVVVLDLTVRSGSDYGVTVVGRNISEGLALLATQLTIWGDPSDTRHDGERACRGEVGPWQTGPTCRSGMPSGAFLRNPTSCTEPGVGLPTTLRVESWDRPGVFDSRTITSHLPPAYPLVPDDWGPPQGPEDCDRVPFNPTLRAAPGVGSKAGGPAAFSFDLEIPQSDDPRVVGQSDLKKAVVTLPQGVRVSPSAAAGLQACSSAQIALRSGSAPTCPEASKIASLTIDTPLLEEQLTGAAYLATPFDNPFDSLIAIYLVAKGPGVVIKLPGEVAVDPRTGQMTTTFDDNPQLPFSRLHLEFKDGPRAPIATPKQCGTYTTHAELTGWNGRTVPYDSSFTLTENARGDPCPSTFAPGWDAGVANPVAGDSAPFSLQLTRGDEDQELSGLTVDMPEGLLGYVSRAVLCAAGDAAGGSCPEGSRIGSVTVGAGAGSNPFYITNGRAYLTGPYKGAPFGLSIVVPAVAGPFDLGDVNVRAALFVDKHDARLRVVSDPFPTILEGIPLDVRDVRVNVDRDGFMVNPTSCAEKSVGGVITSTEGSRANVSSRFQVGECASLGFKPGMAVRVGGRGHTARNRTTPLSTKLVMPKGDANLRFVRVTLPKTINARLTVINDACTRAEFEADLSKCEHARAGVATAVTPLLRDPLKGSVYFVKNGHPLPDLFVALRGQVDFDLVGQITIPGSTRLRTTFAMVPDVPVTSFSLSLFGDEQNGSVGAAANLCAKSSRRQLVELDFIGQNGKVSQVDKHLRVAGCKKQKNAKATRGKGGGRR